ncbi:MAG: hypothetical protein GZ092_11930 [Polaromonas sp.]|nr:hypothetical protein [Polaromonas sp.]
MLPNRLCMAACPGSAAICAFRRRLEKFKLAEGIPASADLLWRAQGVLLRQGSAVDATLIAALPGRLMFNPQRCQ